MITEYIFWVGITICFYAFFGYGFIIFIYNKIFKKEENQIPEYYPDMTLIIAASGESREVIRQKINNTLELDYPAEKLQILFAIANDKSINDETLVEYYNNFLPDIQPVANRYEEEAYIRFYKFENLQLLKNSETLEMFINELNDIDLNSGMINENSMKTLDNYFVQEPLNIGITKDIVRKGKISQVNRTLAKATGEIVVFSDANSFFNKAALKNISRHFANPKVGCVSGEKKILKSEHSTSDEGEGLYWKYESFLKKMDSRFNSVIGAAGEIFAIRKDVMEHNIPENAIIEDFIISMSIARRGYKVVYEPEAYAVEEPTKDIKSEFIRRRRISAGGFQSVVWLKDLLNIFRYGKLSFQYISHRVLRWTVIPFILPMLLLINIQLAGSYFYNVTLFMQIVFYLLAFTGFLFELKNKKIKLFNIPFYFIMMNVLAYYGLKRYFLKEQSVVWERVKR